MLKRCTRSDITRIEELCSDSILGTKILCKIYAYGFDRNFIDIWMQLSNEKATAVILRFYDDVTFVASDDCDLGLIEDFLSMLSYESLNLSFSVCCKLNFSDFTVKKGFTFYGEITEEFGETVQLSEEDYHEAYKLISEEIPGSFENSRDAYLSFLSDFTFRQRRLLARSVCSHIDSRLSSVALTSSETDKSAIISGVACRKDLQKRGLGKKIVLALTKKLLAENKKVYVIALNESAEGFYRHIGFEETEKIAFIERKNDV